MMVDEIYATLRPVVYGFDPQISEQGEFGFPKPGCARITLYVRDESIAELGRGISGVSFAPYASIVSEPWYSDMTSEALTVIWRVQLGEGTADRAVLYRRLVRCGTGRSIGLLRFTIPSDAIRGVMGNESSPDGWTLHDRLEWSGGHLDRVTCPIARVLSFTPRRSRAAGR
jgi:hypothetical protein